MNIKQHKLLTICLIISLLFGAYFLRKYFIMVVFAIILAYLFNPIYKRCLRKTGQKSGLSILLTITITFFVIFIPVTFLLILTAIQGAEMINIIKQSTSGSASLADFLQNFINYANKYIDRIPGHIANPLSVSSIENWVNTTSPEIAKTTINIIKDVSGGLFELIPRAIIFIFVFISLLKNQDKIIHAIYRINPLEEKITKLYLSRIGAMISAMVKGQFAIAFLQGLVDATLLYIAGVDFFFFWLILITFLSIIPLGGGILVIPIGIVMLLTGNIWQGLLLIIGHLLIVTNIDNVLRPKFVPKTAQLDPALTLLSVFGGLAMFGFLGIIIGPVIMIIIVTTIQLYLKVNSGEKTDAFPVSLDTAKNENKQV